jgi:hypothetical protein
MRWQIRRKLTERQKLDITTALFSMAYRSIAHSQQANSPEEKEGWNHEARRYIDAYQAIFGVLAAGRMRRAIADRSRGNADILTAWPPRAPRHAPTAIRFDRG